MLSFTKFETCYPLQEYKKTKIFTQPLQSNFFFFFYHWTYFITDWYFVPFIFILLQFTRVCLLQFVTLCFLLEPLKYTIHYNILLRCCQNPQNSFPHFKPVTHVFIPFKTLPTTDTPSVCFLFWFNTIHNTNMGVP